MDAQPPSKFSAMQLIEALQLTGRLLGERGLGYEVVVIGGASLAIQRLVDRRTVDVDVVAMRALDSAGFECACPLAPQLQKAVEDAATVLQLPPRWMNGTASSDFSLGLPEGCEQRLHSVEYGGLRVSYADRADLVAWKLQAAVDKVGENSRHLHDLRALAPTAEELATARRWFESVETPDSAFWINLEAAIRELGDE